MENNNLKMIREFWGLSAAQMSRIMGFGVNQWREYETGDATPNKSNSNLLMLVASPYTFRKLVLELPEEEKQAMGNRYEKLLNKVNVVCRQIDKEVEEIKQNLAFDWIQKHPSP